MSGSQVAIIECPNREKEFGISMDMTFDVQRDGVNIGKGGISKTSNPNEVFLEWIEFSPAFQGKHYLRSTLRAIASHLHIAEMIVEASEQHKEMYEHLGAILVDYDDFREMWEYRLTIDRL